MLELKTPSRARLRRLATWPPFAFGVFGLIAAVILGFAVLSPTSAQASNDGTYLVTLYGYPDNSPPGTQIAYPQDGQNDTIHSAAGGVGTYQDPITFATDKAELPIGSRIYYPFLHRYFVMEDDCVECDEDWSSQGPDGGPDFAHIDLWIGGAGANSQDVIRCEDDLTRSSAEVTLNPPDNEPVDTTPLFDSATNQCYDPGSFSPPAGGGPTASPTASPAAPTPTNAAPSAGPTTGAASSGDFVRPTAPVSAVAPSAKGGYSAIAGPGCSGSGQAGFDPVGYSGDGTDDWDTVPGQDGTGSGCSNGFLAMPMSGSTTTNGQNLGVWAFSGIPATAKTCTLTVYVPAPQSGSDDYLVGGTNAQYQVFEGDSSSDASSIGRFALDQTAHRGGSVAEGPFTAGQPVLVVRLWDRGIDYRSTPHLMYGLAAIRVDCT